MANIKLIKKDTDLSATPMFKYNWDIEIDGKQYQVVNIPDYVHTLGGKKGANSLWCYPKDEEPCYENLIKFTSDFDCRWGYRIEEKIHHCYHWDEHELDGYIEATITRNDKDFYTFTCRDESYALARIKMLMVEVINEGPISFRDRNYLERDIINRKIFYNNKPAVITAYKNLQVFIEPEDDTAFEPNYPMDDEYDLQCWKEDYGYGHWVDVGDRNIWWWRKSYKVHFENEVCTFEEKGE